MEIRRATSEDIPALHRLLRQVLDVHHEGRPDLFRPNAAKYTNRELKKLLRNAGYAVFVAVCEGEVRGYAFCQLRRYVNANIMTDILTLHIDDLCVDAAVRGQGIGKALLKHVCEYAKMSGCYNVTLNVWACNEAALRFYEHCGMKIQKLGMETIL